MVLKVQNPNNIKVYTVCGEGTSRSLPEWFIRKKKKALKKDPEWSSRIELLQDFEFPEASNKIKVTPDKKYAIATGTYKPHMKIYEFSEMSMKFSRYTNAENVNFEILSNDWTKTVHLQQDRSIEFHTQGGMHYRLRIPKFGRDMGYHFPTCDLLIAATGDEVYRLNLYQGRFLRPFKIDSLADNEEGTNKMGVNTVNINPVHQLFAFGTDNGTVEFWDPRYRSRITILDISRSLNPMFHKKTAEISATSFRHDGLNFSAGTSTGIVLLYDLRSPQVLLQKDQGYDSPIKSIKWLKSNDSVSQLILTSDKKIIKIWDKNSGNPFTSIEPSVDINDVCPLDFTGMIFVANEGVPMHIYYIPALGPAPAWCSFLDNLTEEMEENPIENIYENYKFLTKNELKSLGLDHLIGSNVIRSYMHGFFIDFRLYETAKSIMNPFAYVEYREKAIKDKIEKERQSRIRSSTKITKINHNLAQHLLHKEEKDRMKKKGNRGPSVLEDERFKDVFNDPDYEIDENTVEFMQLNPIRSKKNYENSKTISSSESEKKSIAYSFSGTDDDNDESEEADFYQKPKNMELKAEDKEIRMKVIEYYQPSLNTMQNESFETLIKMQEQNKETEKKQDLMINDIKRNINGKGNMEMTFLMPKKKNNINNNMKNTHCTLETEKNDLKQVSRRRASKNTFRKM
ncbi:hypothetical protein PNEG_02070 [Pneumocystis murina B123]|uniref:Uncharacterized protein n=1 Tax=Pneumocystis murina (strain B123) TaxID=1069680 RepID=M7NQD5_PNEMU|nr:hypothetical protein PNEG_02070 [Pneumocystis murina B123]EMR09482.1 hypothetical protein PNEG_02070 [Pneumocystis murina B123]